MTSTTTNRSRNVYEVSLYLPNGQQVFHRKNIIYYTIRTDPNCVILTTNDGNNMIIVIGNSTLLITETDWEII